MVWAARLQHQTCSHLPRLQQLELLSEETPTPIGEEYLPPADHLAQVSQGSVQADL